MPIAKLEEIFTEHFTVYPPQNIRNNQPVDNEFRKALEQYERANYQAFLEAVDILNLQNSSTQLYRSNALLAIGAFREAIPVLEH